MAEFGSNNTSVNHQTDRYKHPCPWEGCERMFTCPHNVEQHIREKHTKEKPHECWLCSAAFPRPFSLNRHMDMVHQIQIGPGRGKTKRKQAGVNVHETSNSIETSSPATQEGVEPNIDPLLTADEAFGFPSDLPELSVFAQQQIEALVNEQDQGFANGYGMTSTNSNDQEVKGYQHDLADITADGLFDFDSDDTNAGSARLCAETSTEESKSVDRPYVPQDDGLMDLDEGFDQWLQDAGAIFGGYEGVKMGDADDILGQL